VKFEPITKKPETLNSIIARISRLDIDFIQWADVVYMLSDTGEVPKEDLENKLEIRLPPRRPRKIYESVIKG